MAKINGLGFTLFLGTGATKTILAGSRTCTLDDKKAKIDTSSRDGVSFLLGPSEYTLTADGVIDFVATGSSQNFTSVVQIYQAGLDVNWQFGGTTTNTYPQALDTSNKYFSGTVKITDLKVSSQYKGAVEYSLSMANIGDFVTT
jgi:predicted secreted protein